MNRMDHSGIPTIRVAQGFNKRGITCRKQMPGPAISYGFLKEDR
jgi:hypothetical protein